MKRFRFLSVLGLCACALKPLPVPPTSAPEGQNSIEVPYPPPPAKVDLIKSPPPEYKDPVWVDGSWSFRGLRWVWEPGRWYDWKPGDVYRRPTVVRLGDGRLIFFPGQITRVSAARRL